MVQERCWLRPASVDMKQRLWEVLGGSARKKLVSGARGLLVWPQPYADRELKMAFLCRFLGRGRRTWLWAHRQMGFELSYPHFPCAWRVSILWAKTVFFPVSLSPTHPSHKHNPKDQCACRLESPWAGAQTDGGVQDICEGWIHEHKWRKQPWAQGEVKLWWRPHKALTTRVGSLGARITHLMLGRNSLAWYHSRQAASKGVVQV